METPQAVLGADGAATLAPMVHAAGPRCRGLHYGTYDYSASLGIAAAHQSVRPPRRRPRQADHAGRRRRHRRPTRWTGRPTCSRSGPATQVHAGWRLHAGLVRRALGRGFYQGWDLHPAQLVTRYVATYAFFREAMPRAAGRLRDYVGQVGGSVLDEPATAKALAAVLVRGLDCGALDEDEVLDAAAVDRETLAALAGRAS